MLSLELGESRIPELLLRRKKTQASLARRLGVSPQFISQVIKKERTLSLTQAINAAHFLECRVEDLYHIHVVKNPDIRPE